MLSLRIDNFDKLPNGSPLEYSVDRRGFDFGRDQHLDWTLPDKNRVVSGKHCEVRYYDNAYWLIDTSTNGTFLNDSSKRVQSPYLLKDGDKLAIGDYIVFVSVNLNEPKQQSDYLPNPIQNIRSSEQIFNSQSHDNIWETQGNAPPPIDARDLMPKPIKHERVPDFLSQAALMPAVFNQEPIRKPNPAPTPQQSIENNPHPQTDQHSAQPNYFTSDEFPPRQAMSEKPVRQIADFITNDAKLQPVGVSSSDSESEFVKRFAKGAGIAADALGQKNAGDLAEQAGQLLNVVCQQLIIMLHARAEAKALSRSGNRTLIQSTDNNPLKFMPSAEEALKTMLSPPSRGYLDATAAIEGAFSDLKIHQVASLAAMQSAAVMLFEDLSPEAIEKAAGAKKSLLGGGKSKFWDIYAQRWASKVGIREHGMLGAFLELFAEQYDKLSKRK